MLNTIVPTRLFAIIIGIDNYKSGRIWDLQSCVEDAKRMKRYLIDDLNVPRDQICLLLDRQATKKAIEDNIMMHLVNNTAIEHGDAILIYFAGHGSVIPAPEGWFLNEECPGPGNAEVLCPYDHDTKEAGGRVAGISDRSMLALIREVSQAKGDNITFIADCCFSPLQSHMDALHRSVTRWTPTVKAKPDDLYLGLWPSARGQPCPKGFGFYDTHPTTHVFLAGCGPGDKAVEGKNGGKFTTSLLRILSEATLHCTSYATLFDRLHRSMVLEGQKPVCLGKYKARVIFNAVPFVVDARFIPVTLGDHTSPRIEVGAVQGVVEGSEFSLHIHNHRASRNPPIATVIISELHPTWSISRIKSARCPIPKTCWAKITRWNNSPPFYIHLRPRLTSFCRWWKLRRNIPVRVGGPPSKAGLSIRRVKNAKQADISLTVGSKNVTAETHDHDNKCSVIVERRDPLDVIDDAALFRLHLHRKNPECPLRGLVDMELFHLDPISWTRIGSNLITDGKATISYEKGAIFSIIVRNESDTDLWPYLFYMDPNCYGITNLYYPVHDATMSPLPRNSCLEIGTGTPGSEALSFTLSEHSPLDSGFLKLFLAPTPIPTMMEQSTLVNSLVPKNNTPSSGIPKPVWDTISTHVQFLKH